MDQPSRDINCPQDISGVPLVWLVGSSIIKRAFPIARQEPSGSSLGLPARLWWQGYGGLTLGRTKRKLDTLRLVEDPPDFMLLHVGGNDLRNTPLKKLKDIICQLVEHITNIFPNTVIIWSEILPRNWGPENKGIYAARKRLNTLAVKTVKNAGGFYLRHLNLKNVTSQLYLPDGVHLSHEGNKLFVQNIQWGLSNFLRGVQPWFS